VNGAESTSQHYSDAQPPWTSEDGLKVKNVRNSRGDSQTTVGLYMKDHGSRHTSQSYVSRMEAGHVSPSGADAEALRSYLVEPVRPQGVKPLLRLLDDLGADIEAGSGENSKLDALATDLHRRIAETSGFFQEYDWRVVELLVRLYQR
jgi:hypothetical protein